MKQNHWLCE